MSPAAIRLNRYTNQRRSQRVLLSIQILVTGKRGDGQPFAEETETVVVSVHGGLIFLAESVNAAQPLTVRNLKSGEVVLCTVIDVGPAHDGKREVGIQFLESSEKFWRVSFPPEHWSPHSPEAKRFSAGTISIVKPKPQGLPLDSGKK